MIATSEGDVFQAGEFPQCLFSRKYIGKSFVAYNLSYDEGALLQHLPEDVLHELWKSEEIEYGGYTYFLIPKKYFSVTRNKKSIHIYDCYGFFLHSLDWNAKKYLHEKKIGVDVKKFTRAYVKKHWDMIGRYCVHDADLTRRLMELLIRKFEKFGIYPKRLYSTAYISFQYFRKNTHYVHVKRYWDHYREVLDFAMASYQGGKFEVTEKGSGYFYEYDISSAYPYEISELVDISHARVVRSKKYRRYAQYAFLNCRMNIPVNIHSPVVNYKRGLCTYPVGEIERVITKEEYDYLEGYGADIIINDAYWLHIDRPVHPYKREVKKLFELKSGYKRQHADLDYHTIKIFLNSLYGKFLQLIDKDDHWEASTCWNPIYGSIVTANVRVRMSFMQQEFPAVVAVHTDSIISKEKLNFHKSGDLGDMIYETEGTGVIIGSGIYQVGKKTRFRGFNLKTPLLDLIDIDTPVLKLKDFRAYTWKEIQFHGWDKSKINRFFRSTKDIHVDFDCKRVWIDDYKKFSELLVRNVMSVPIIQDALL